MKKHRIESNSQYMSSLRGWVLTGTHPHEPLFRNLLCGRMDLALSNIAKNYKNTVADDMVSWITDVGQLIEEKMPSCCWGSDETVKAWKEGRGFGGLPDQKQVELKLSGDFDYWLNDDATTNQRQK